MYVVDFDTTEPLNELARDTLRGITREVFGSEPVKFVRQAGGRVSFGVNLPSAFTLATNGDSPSVRNQVAKVLREYLPPVKLTPWGDAIAPKSVLYLDIETHDAEKMWDMSLTDFFRLGQFAFGPTGEIILTTNLNEVLEAIQQAEGIIAHNGHPFDFSVLLGDDALELAMGNRLFDTMVFANLALPPPSLFEMRSGRKVFTDGKPEMISLWLSLDNLAFKLDVGAKEGDLKALAKEFGGFGNIPVDDERYLAYARNDITMLQDVTHELLLCKRPTSYDWREQQAAAIMAQMSRNGFKVDVAAAQARVAELAARKDALMVELVRDYGLPTKGTMPWRSTAGKQAVLAALSTYGITPENTPDWPILKTGPSLSGPVILQVTAGTEAEAFGETIAELQGQRPLAAQALEYCHSDGKVHPSITMWQKSGRMSLTRPGLTTWTARGPRAVEKAYFVAESGTKLLEADYSQADARAVAAMSDDKEFAKRFEPGVDAHELSGLLFYGESYYDSMPEGWETNPDIRRSNPLRHISKNCIAAGQLVLTDHGLVPIEKVSPCMLLWDGIDWVSHQGVIHQGVQEVITYGGLTATPDHIVFAKEAGAEVEISLGDASSRNIPLVKTGSGGNTIRIGASHSTREVLRKVQETLLRRSSMHTLRSKWLGNLAERCSRAIPGVPYLWECYFFSLSGMASQKTHRRETALREPEETFVPLVRGAGGSIQLQKRSGSGHVYRGELFLRRHLFGNRPNRYQRTLRAGEHSIGRPQNQPGKSEDNRFESLRPGLLAVCSDCGSKTSISGTVPRTDYRESETISNRKEEKLEGYSGKVDVYDIYLAGPRSRFTVSNTLVHNCAHALGYRVRDKRLSEMLKMSRETTKGFVEAFITKYRLVDFWQQAAEREALKTRGVKNRWGRKMPVDKGREFNQACALLGQSSTREILVDALIKMWHADPRSAKWWVAPVHDAMIYQIPDDLIDYSRDLIVECMEFKWDDIDFPVELGEPADTWFAAGH